jgi:hypothetical protein
MARTSGDRPLDLVCIENINKGVDTCYNELTDKGRTFDF